MSSNWFERKGNEITSPPSIPVRIISFSASIQWIRYRNAYTNQWTFLSTFHERCRKYKLFEPAIFCLNLPVRLLSTGKTTASKSKNNIWETSTLGSWKDTYPIKITRVNILYNNRDPAFPGTSGLHHTGNKQTSILLSTSRISFTFVKTH